MTDRRKARILAMQALCQLEVLGDEMLGQLDAFLSDESPPAAVVEYAKGLALDAWGHREDIDARIQAVSEHWLVGRMTAVDRNVLRVAVCELLHQIEVPPKVVMDEAIEIGKSFGTADSAAFINGILEGVLSSPDAQSPDDKPSVETTGT